MGIDDDYTDRHAGRPAAGQRSAGGRGRGVAVLAAMATVVLGLTAGCGQRAGAEGTSAQPTTAAATPDGAGLVPWVSALVARNGTAVTVYTGPGDAKCSELYEPRATVTEQDGAQVVVAVRGRVIESVDCAASGSAVPLVVSLRAPLGDRALRDAATGTPHPVYHERDLPDLTADRRWSPYESHWMSTDEGWHRGYNGPNGSGLLLSAQPTAAVSRPEAVATVRIGSRDGGVTGQEGRWWTLWWEAGEVTYSLRLMPREGGSFTLAEFERELARLKWS
ncbi:hypothetical protein GA0070609_5175 [Micromonospora echinaurantiaca]|uniref:Uncharacterized protein n=1 Tax=Micromonospora echinaurantiaca TaxID=47857 RepID=A0A1C5JZ49_9ACTN|nr:hypothetical protein [Micromonospora echinaurantiaca]SCG75850.1 hypothetical protein GA0070609_5175 [Micromonospora echinaurantiaca]